MLKKNMNKGFTLIELLVVITIIAVLAGVVLVALDPLERVRESRDSRRQQDLQNVRQALDLALTDSEIVLAGDTTTSATGASNTDGGVIDAVAGGAVNTGWVKFTVPTGMEGMQRYIPSLPLDPQGVNAPCAGGYLFASDGTKYELNTCFETTKFQALYTTDGGSDVAVYEIGNGPGLTTIP